MAIKAPILLSPLGPGAPVTVFSFRFPLGAAQPDPAAWDGQVSRDQAFTDLVHTATNSTAYISGRNVDWDWNAETVLELGRYYWWRARGRETVGGTPGPWCIPGRFTVDRFAIREPYADWARAVMAGISVPRNVTILNTLHPTGAQVAQLLTLEYGALLRLIETEHPPATDRTLQLLGTQLHVDAVSGWAVEVTTIDA
jgi:hypothetical protein